MKKSVAAVLLLAITLSGCSRFWNPTSPTGSGASFSIPTIASGADLTAHAAVFGSETPYSEPTVAINPDLAKDFSIADVKNIDAITKAYGITLSPDDKKLLAERKFVMKRLPDTSIQPLLSGDRDREFLGLYNAVSGGDEKSRTQANTLFWSSDIFLHSYSLLETELLKEMENTMFAPSMKTLSKAFFEAASAHLAQATSDADRVKWTKVRNYFAVPYALLSTSLPTLTDKDYQGANGNSLDPTTVQANFQEKDKNADSEDAAKAFITSLKLDKESEGLVLSDLATVYAARGKDTPAIFKPEYDAYTAKMHIDFGVDFSQFTPRSHYTSSSLRRQYFRAMNWYIQLPFFVESDPLTTYAFAISQLMAEHPQEQKSYGLLEATVNFLVGTSDDLMPSDYLTALEETKGQSDQAAAIRAALLKMKSPRIKNLPASYPSIGQVQSADVLAATKGMRFFSGKFILDSYWTGYLTQGDEAPRPGYAQKLPPMASSLEVLSLLGSTYATQKIPTLDFYTPDNAKAIDQAMSDLRKETEAMTENDWRENAYTTALWVVRGLFSFSQDHRFELPSFMQSDAWPAEVLESGAGFWTELRHTVLLYAKQSFAELGGGGPCDTRTVPEPAKGYIEPQLVAYTRLRYLAERTLTGLQDLGFALQNFVPLKTYISTMDTVIGYTQKELSDQAFSESISKHNDSDCIWYNVDRSDWEPLRKELVNDLKAALPIPVEGPVLSVKDKRAAIVADVHTGGDSAHPTRILYEGTGIPYVILVAVKDTNGPRLAIGFTYSQFETTEPYGGQRKTDEQWQQNFYKGTDDNAPFDYTAPSAWPKLNSWFGTLFNTH